MPFYLTPMQQKVILLGPWNVWRTFIKQVLKYDSISSKRHNNPTVIMWIATWSELLFDPYWLKDDVLDEISDSWDISKFSPKQISSSQEILNTVKDHWLNWEIIFVDATAAKDEMKDFHLAIMEQSDNSIVTANKNPISLYDYDTYKRLTKNLRYQYTTSVMAWSGIVRFLRWTRKVSDQIYSLNWVFSGTLWYICWELDKWKKISEVVLKAKELWYTEPNPWDDLNWLDVARKLIILARSAWYPINIEDIEVKPFLPKRFWDIENIDDFLQEIKTEDQNFEDKVSSAKQNWKVLRYLASLKINNWNLSLSVWLEQVDVSSPTWQLSGPSNFVQVITDFYDESSPYIIQSPWAWLEVTAGSLRKDMLSFLPRLENADSSKDK